MAVVPVGETTQKTQESVVLPPNGKGAYRLALVPASRIRIGPRFRDIVGDLSSFANTIDKDGLLQPPVVTVINSENNQDTSYDLVAGFRRLKAMTEFLKWELVPVLLAAGIDSLDAEVAENVERLDPTASERVKAGLEFEKKFGRKAGRPEKGCEDPDKGKTTDALIAKRVGLGSAENYRKAKKVYLSGDAELVKLMDSGPHKVDAAYTALKDKKNACQTKANNGKGEVAGDAPESQASTSSGRKRNPGTFPPSRSPKSAATASGEAPTPGDSFAVQSFTQAMTCIHKCLEEHGAFDLKPEVIDGVLCLPAVNPRLALIVAVFKVNNFAKLIGEGTLTLKVAK